MADQCQTSILADPLAKSSHRLCIVKKFDNSSKNGVFQHNGRNPVIRYRRECSDDVTRKRPLELVVTLTCRHVPQPLSRKLEQANTHRCLSRPGNENPKNERGDQETDNPETSLAAPIRCRLNSNRNRTRAPPYQTARSFRKTLTTDSREHPLSNFFRISTDLLQSATRLCIVARIQSRFYCPA